MISRRKFLSRIGAAAGAGAIAARLNAQLRIESLSEEKVDQPIAEFLMTVGPKGIKIDLHRLDEGDVILTISADSVQIAGNELGTYQTNLERRKSDGSETDLAHYEGFTAYEFTTVPLHIQNGKLDEKSLNNVTEQLHTLKFNLTAAETQTLMDRLAKKRKDKKTLVLSQDCSDPTIARDPLRLKTPAVDLNPQAKCKTSLHR